MTPNLKNCVADHGMRAEVKEDFENELQTWIEEGGTPFQEEAIKVLCL